MDNVKHIITEIGTMGDQWSRIIIGIWLLSLVKIIERWKIKRNGKKLKDFSHRQTGVNVNKINTKSI